MTKVKWVHSKRNDFNFIGGFSMEKRYMLTIVAFIATCAMTGVHVWLHELWHRNLGPIEPSWDAPHSWMYHKSFGFIGSKPFQSVTGNSIAYYPLVDLKSYISNKSSRTSEVSKVEKNKRVFGNLLSLPLPSQNSNVFAILTRTGQGTSHDSFNQDRSVLIHPFLTPKVVKEKGSSVQSEEDNFFLGIFDGHGASGHEVAELASMKLPLFLEHYLVDNKQAKSPEEKESIAEEYVHKSLTQSFQQVNDMVFKNSYSGTTAAVCLRLSNTLYISNVGDSYLLVAAYSYSTGQVTIIYQNRQDKPHLPGERERIESSGGEVTMPDDRVMGLSSRVVAKYPESEEFYALAMSRSLGDNEVPGVIAQPLIDTIDISQYTQKDSKNGLFVVAFTDGLIGIRSQMTTQQIAERLGQSLYISHSDGEGKLQDHAILACEDLIRKASGESDAISLYSKYRDDMTIVVKKIG